MLFKGLAVPEKFLINLRYTFAAPEKERICVAWERAVRERLRVIKRHCKPTRCYDIAKIVHPWLEELKFLELESNSGLSQWRQDLVYMSQMTLDVLGEYYHVIQVYQAHLPAHARQDNIMCSLKRGWRVSQPEWHPEVREGSKVRRECSLVPIFRCSGHFPIARVAVKRREYCCVPK